MSCPYTKAKMLLKNQKLTSDRSALQFDPFEVDGILLPQTKAFYSNWLMYMEGDDHKLYRKKVIDILSKKENRENGNVLEYFSAALKAQEVDHTTIMQTVQIWHRDFLGLSKDQQDEIFALAQPVLNFFFYDEFPDNDPQKLEDAVEKLQIWLDNNSFPQGSIMHELQDAGLPDGVILNTIIDSYEPVLAAASSVIANSQRVIEGDVSSILCQILQENPPFRYINRYDTNSRSKVSIDLLEANVDSPKPRLHLSFGFGQHACPGGKASFNFLSELATLIKEAYETRPIIITPGQRDTKSGFCRYKDYKLGLK